MPGVRAEIYQDRAGEWRWRVRAANGELVANSAGDGFATPRKAEEAFATAAAAMQRAAVVSGDA